MNLYKTLPPKTILISSLLCLLIACNGKHTEEKATIEILPVAEKEIETTTATVGKNIQEKELPEQEEPISTKKAVAQKEAPTPPVDKSKEQQKQPIKETPDSNNIQQENDTTTKEAETIKPEETEEPVTETNESEEVVVEQKFPNHTPWDALTKQFVTSDGNVDYDGFSERKSDITDYITELKNIPPQPEWSKNEVLAYWINLYNALTVDLILKHYPIKTIMNINRGKAWDLEVVSINDKVYSLNNIEHDVIRKNFNEPRIHFAVNCAATSCPKLLNGAFFPDQLDKQLDSQAIYFINNTAKNQIDQKSTRLSRIFDWYGTDFGDLKTYIARYHKDFNSEAPITFLEYDWRLNK